MFSLKQSLMKENLMFLVEETLLFYQLFLIHGFCSWNGVYSFTRSTYSPVLVWILILSPVFTKRGTRISEPFSKVAGFNVRVAVSPCMPGSVYCTSMTTWVGGSAVMALSPFSN